MTTAHSPARSRRRGLRALGTTIVAALAAAALVACATAPGNAGTDPTSSSGAESAAFPVTLEHVFGNTTITKRPERIVTLGWYSGDVVAALGVVPVGNEDFTWGEVKGNLPWFADRVKELGGTLPELIRFTDAGEYDFESILALEPDLILAVHSGIDEPTYKRLTEIAPTVAFKKSAWASERDDLTRTVAAALGQPEKAEPLLKASDDAIAAAAAAHPEFRGVTYTYGWYLAEGATSLDLYLPRDPRIQMTDQLGFTTSPQVTAAESTTENFYASISLEKLAEVTSDFHIGWADSQDEIDRTLNNPLVTRWAPVAAGKTSFFFGDYRLAWATTAPSVLSIPATIDDIAVKLSADLGTGK